MKFGFKIVQTNMQTISSDIILFVQFISWNWQNYLRNCVLTYIFLDISRTKNDRFSDNFVHISIKPYTIVSHTGMVKINRQAVINKMHNFEKKIV